MRGRTFIIALIGSIVAGVALGQLQRAPEKPDTLHQPRDSAVVQASTIANPRQPAPQASGGLKLAMEALPVRSIQKHLPPPAFGTDLRPALELADAATDIVPPPFQRAPETLGDLQPIPPTVPMVPLPSQAKVQSELVIVRASQGRPTRTIEQLEAGTRGNKVSISLPPSQNSDTVGQPPN